jgi:hypothetical protein
MKIQTHNKDDKWYEHRLFLKGYGLFPYIIVKRGCALYMQIPIHFNAYGDVINYPGTHINGISDAEIADYQKDKSVALHDRIIEHCKWIKHMVEAKVKEQCKICLVESPNTAYYFEGDTISFDSCIPSGGTLFTQDNKVLAMNIEHYLLEQLYP